MADAWYMRQDRPAITVISIGYSTIERVGHVESHTRSIAKAVSYRILGSTTTAVIFFVLTGKMSLSLGAGALDMVLKIGAYFVHERIWNHINFGRTNVKAPEYEI